MVEAAGVEFDSLFIHRTEAQQAFHLISGS